MLKKLIKHEWKDTWLIGTICSIIVLAFAVIGLFIFNEDIWQESTARSDMASNLTMLTMSLYLMTFFIGLTATAFIVKYYFFWRYYKNLFTDQGYLMNTLPVKCTDLINAKLIVAVIWHYIINIVIGLGIIILIMCFSSSIIPSHDEARFWQEILELYQEIVLSKIGAHIPFLIGISLCGLLAPVVNVLLMFTAVGIEQLAKKNKFLFSVLILIGFMFCRRTIAYFISMPIALVMDTRVTSTNAVDAASFIFVFIFTGAIIVLYLLNKYFLKKKLNLE